MDFVERAKEIYEEDGKIEIDNEAQVTEVTHGAYVEAWVFVPYTPEERVARGLPLE